MYDIFNPGIAVTVSTKITFVCKYKIDTVLLFTSIHETLRKSVFSAAL